MGTDEDIENWLKSCVHSEPDLAHTGERGVIEAAVNNDRHSPLENFGKSVAPLEGFISGVEPPPGSPLLSEYDTLAETEGRIWKEIDRRLHNDESAKDHKYCITHLHQQIGGSSE